MLAIRLSPEEKDLIGQAAQLTRTLGDRTGASSWARRVLLSEAQRVVRDQPSAAKPALEGPAT